MVGENSFTAIYQRKSMEFRSLYNKSFVEEQLMSSFTSYQLLHSCMQSHPFSTISNLHPHLCFHILPPAYTIYYLSSPLFISSSSVNLSWIDRPVTNLQKSNAGCSFGEFGWRPEAVRGEDHVLRRHLWDYCCHRRIDVWIRHRHLR